MITVQQARRYFPANQTPSDKEIEQALAFMYFIGEREYDRLLCEGASKKKDEQS